MSEKLDAAPAAVPGRSLLASPVVAGIAALAIALVVHWVIGAFAGTTRARSLDPNSWYLQTLAFALGVRFVWLGRVAGRTTYVGLGTLLGIVALLWMLQTG
jgi:hypothetical protein